MRSQTSAPKQPPHLKSVRQQLGQRYSPIINGEAVTTDIALFDSVNPSNSSGVIGKVGLARSGPG
jgi:RHH-type proline utilization regulon transcriptional repressor/proline dehydrogenase/delta 1-pyrroline-5-carboxylate dehydrogenase